MGTRTSTENDGKSSSIRKCGSNQQKSAWSMGLKFREKIHCDGIVCALSKKTYQSIHLTFQKKIEEEECCLPEEIFSKQKKNENKSLLCLFRVPFVVMRIIFTTK